MTITLPPTSNLFDVGHRIRARRLVVELAAARRQPEHRRADRAAHAPGRRRAGGVRRRRAPVARRPAGDPAAERSRRRSSSTGASSRPARSRWAATPPRSTRPTATRHPRHEVEVDAFRLGRTPVTNAQYAAFVQATGQPPPAAWPDGTVPRGRELHPVTYVSWDEADAFCRWAGGFLPTEAQWERAARGDDRAHVAVGRRAAAAGARRARARRTRDPVGRSAWRGQGRSATSTSRATPGSGRRARYTAYPYAAATAERRRHGDARRARRRLHPRRRPMRDARRGTACFPRTVDHYVGFRLAAAPGVDSGRDRAARRSRRDRRSWERPAPVRRAGAAGRGRRGTRSTSTRSSSRRRRSRTTQYAAFVRATGHAAPIDWDGGDVPAGSKIIPSPTSTGTTRRPSARWAGGRLPTEAEWEKARARRRRAPLPVGRRRAGRRPGARRRRPRSTGRRRRSVPHRAARRRTVSSTWPGTSGSGCRARTGRTRTTPATAARTRRATSRACCAAARTRASPPATCAARGAARAGRGDGAPTSASGSRRPVGKEDA